jgi:hypothetical protein
VRHLIKNVFVKANQIPRHVTATTKPSENSSPPVLFGSIGGTP